METVDGDAIFFFFFLYVTKSSRTSPRLEAARYCRTIRTKPNGGQTYAQLGCPGPMFYVECQSECLLLSDGIVPWLVRALGGSTSLNAIPSAVVQICGGQDPPRRVGLYDHVEM